MNLRQLPFFTILILLITASSALLADTTTDSTAVGSKRPKRKYFTQRIQAAPPKIDGQLNDICWKEGTWSGDYTQHLPAEGAKPTAETYLKILYDDDNMYVAIRAMDDPAKIHRFLDRRDNFQGDIVGVCFDSYFDHRTGFEFDLTAAGAKLDLVLKNDGWDTNWDAVWHGKVGEEDSAWVAEFRIPLSQLRYADKSEHVWGLHSWRWINRNQEEDQWNLIPRDHPGWVYSIGELYGIKGIKPKRRIELLPYSVGKIQRSEEVPGNPFATGQTNNLSVGLDGKVGLGSNLTMDFSINPDFGQVEADPSVLNLTVFETFYDEKRPFFLEGQAILDYSFDNNLLFYSRRIGHSPSHYPDLQDNEYTDFPENTSILGAFKISGKTANGISLGIMETITAKEMSDIALGAEHREEAVEPLTNYFVGRVQKDINQSNTIIGGIFTATNRRIQDSHLEFLPDAAYTGGLDFRHHWHNKTYYLDVKTIFSHVRGSEESILRLQQASSRYYQRPDADYVELDPNKKSLSGHGGRITLGRESNGKLRLVSELNWRSPGLELNDLGYMSLADQIEPSLKLGYVETHPKGIFRRYSGYLGTSRIWNFGSDCLSAIYSLNSSWMFKNRWGGSLEILRHNDALDTRLLRGGPAVNVQGAWSLENSWYTDNGRKLIFDLTYFTEHNDDKTTQSNGVYPGISYKVTNALKLNSYLSYNVARELLHYVGKESMIGGTRYLLAQLDRKTLGITFRIDFALTPELIIQYYGSPYLSVGDYSHFKYISNARAKDYSEMYTEISDKNLVLNESENSYEIYESNPDKPYYEFENPNFNFREFRSNLVVRWEFRPGSTFYLVWTHGRSQWENVSNYSLRHNMDHLWDIYPTNIFLTKFSYWFAL